MTFERADIGKIWSLAEADALAIKHNCQSANVAVAIRCDYDALRGYCQNKNKEDIKKYFQSKRASVIRALVKGV